MRKFIIIPALVGSLALGGCMTADNKLRENLVAVCDVLEVAYGTYAELEASIPIPQKYKDAIKAAYDPAHKTCLTPETATTLKLIADVTLAGFKIYNILKDITNTSPAAMEAITE